MKLNYRQKSWIFGGNIYICNDFNILLNNYKSFHMKKHLLVLITLLSVSVSLTAQKKKEDKKTDKELIAVEADKEVVGDGL